MTSASSEDQPASASTSLITSLIFTQTIFFNFCVNRHANEAFSSRYPFPVQFTAKPPDIGLFTEKQITPFVVPAFL
jgi:hypothetical protein